MWSRRRALLGGGASWLVSCDVIPQGIAREIEITVFRPGSGWTVAAVARVFVFGDGGCGGCEVNDTFGM